MWPNLQIPVDLFKFAVEILHEKLHFLGSDLTKDDDQKLPTSPP